jgi:EAL domain-containing protein (putative c-di-GMP-specific phosphodiesterase class I)/GGDEF domain-containing protein
MYGAAREALERWQHMSRRLLSRIEVLALFPILVLGAQATGRPSLVLAAAMVLPSLLVLQNAGVRARSVHVAPPRLAPSADRTTVVAMLDRIARMQGMETACFVLEIDDWSGIERRIGPETARDVLDECDRRLRAALRGDDLVADLDMATFGVVLHPISAARLGIRDAIADRLRAGLAAPILVGDTSLRLTASVGHAALGCMGETDAETVLAGAWSALREARAAGPGAVRAHVPGRTGRGQTPSELTHDVPEALASRAIVAWFQPQIDARSGRVTGFEALARWDHPVHGLLTPDRFLEALEQAGRMEELSARIRQQAIEALIAWDDAGHGPLTVSVNAGEAELRSPDFAEHVAWDLDRAGVEPARLIVEVLESVAADARDDTILATLSALRSQGISLDLDDFGVGQASLLSIRRFGVRRIKIDRSFVIGIAEDVEQQAMVGGIVSLGRSMGLEALAEGVETQQQQATLLGLGCSFMQGFGIGKPMPLHDTFAWLAARETMATPPRADMPEAETAPLSQR